MKHDQTPRRCHFVYTRVSTRRRATFVGTFVHTHLSTRMSTCVSTFAGAFVGQVSLSSAPWFTDLTVTEICLNPRPPLRTEMVKGWYFWSLLLFFFSVPSLLASHFLLYLQHPYCGKAMRMQHAQTRKSYVEGACEGVVLSEGACLSIPKPSTATILRTPSLTKNRLRSSLCSHCSKIHRKTPSKNASLKIFCKTRSRTFWPFLEECCP